MKPKQLCGLGNGGGHCGALAAEARAQEKVTLYSQGNPLQQRGEISVD